MSLQRHNQVGPMFTVTDLTHTVLKRRGRGPICSFTQKSPCMANNHFHSKALFLLQSPEAMAVLGVPRINVHFTATTGGD